MQFVLGSTPSRRTKKKGKNEKPKNKKNYLAYFRVHSNYIIFYNDNIFFLGKQSWEYIRILSAGLNSSFIYFLAGSFSGRISIW